MSETPREPIASRWSARASRSPSTSLAVAAGGLLLGLFLIHAALAIAGQATPVSVLSDLMRGQITPVGDSWSVMILAHDWLGNNPGADGALYRELFFGQGYKFQYAPTSLLVLEVFIVAGVEPTPSLLNSVNLVLVLATALVMARFSWLLPEYFGAVPMDGDGRRARILLTGAAPLATLLFTPVMYAYELGQLQVWINALFASACLCWIVDRKGVAGVLIALVCLMKPQFGLFVVWGLLRREWCFSVWLVATGLAGGLLSVWLYGFGNHLAYLEVLSFLSRHGESFWANQSANGMLHRIVGSGATSQFDAAGFPPYNPLVHAGTLFISLAMLSLVLLLRQGEGKAAALCNFLLAALVFTIASPIAWEHHYGVTLPIFAVLVWVLLIREAPRELKVAGGGLAVLFLAMAVRLVPLKYLSGPFHVLQSHIWIAALCLMAILWRLAQGGWRITLPWRRSVRPGRDG